MFVSLLKEHHRYFQENGFIIFEELLKKEELESINERIDQYFAEKRLDQALATFEDIWQLGRNLSFLEPFLRKIVCQKKMAFIASELSKIRPLRLGFDQILQSTLSSVPNFLLEEISQIRGQQTALFLCLKSSAKSTDSTLLPSAVGSALFVSGTEPLPFNELTCQAGQEQSRYLMLLYTEKCAFYTPSKEDRLFSKDWKKRSYSFGDSLKEGQHPLLIT